MATHRPELTALMLVDEIDESLRAVPERAAAQVRRSYRWVIVAALAVSVIVSVATSVIAISTAQNASAITAAAEANRTERDRTVDAALSGLRDANADLAARGQAPVQTGPTPDPTEAIAAAVTARVLASLPPTPTAEQVGVAISGAVTTNLLGPSRDQLSQLVSDYFAAHPPQPGPAPTQEQIQAAVDANLAQHPPMAGRDGDKGEKGDTGAQGVGVQDVRTERADDGTCQLVFVLVDPADGTTSEKRVPARDATCDDDGGILGG